MSRKACRTYNLCLIWATNYPARFLHPSVLGYGAHRIYSDFCSRRAQSRLSVEVRLRSCILEPYVDGSVHIFQEVGNCGLGA